MKHSTRNIILSTFAVIGVVSISFAALYKADDASASRIDIDVVTKIDAGSAHALALTTHGNVYSFGANDQAQLGDSVLSNQDIYRIPADTFGNVRVVDIAAGTANSFAVTSDGLLWAWGYNGDGRLGTGSTIPEYYPTSIDPSAFNDELIVSIATCESHSLALTGSGSLYSWGVNDHGQLGIGTTEDSLTPQLISSEYFDSAISKIDVGQDFSMVLTTNSSMYTWGDNTYGQCGLDSDPIYGDFLTPTCIDSFYFNYEIITDFAAGYRHAVATTSLSHTYTWGANEKGQLGNATYDIRLAPNMISFQYMNDKTIVDISAGEATTVAIDNMGTVQIWGDNSHNQIYDPGFYGDDSNVPIALNPCNFDYYTMLNVYSGTDFHFVMTTDGDIYSWGNNEYYQSGRTMAYAYTSRTSLISPEDIFASNLFDYKTCTEYSTAYTELNDDYTELSETQKSRLPDIFKDDYGYLNNPTEEDYATAQKNISVGADDKWEAISALANAESATHNISAIQNNENSLLLLISLLLVTFAGGVFFFNRKHKLA